MNDIQAAMDEWQLIQLKLQQMKQYKCDENNPNVISLMEMSMKLENKIREGLPSGLTDKLRFRKHELN